MSTRSIRYAGVSVLAMLLAQGALALAYGVLRWPVVPSVLFSLAMSVGPAYALSRRWVWPSDSSAGPALGEAAKFISVAIFGACTSIVLVWSSVNVAEFVTDNHVTLTAVANVSSLCATGIVWIGRYFVLDRFVFRSVIGQTDRSEPRGSK